MSTVIVCMITYIQNNAMSSQPAESLPFGIVRGPSPINLQEKP
jgi:hypothetical protein